MGQGIEGEEQSDCEEENDHLSAAEHFDKTLYLISLQLHAFTFYLLLEKPFWFRSAISFFLFVEIKSNLRNKNHLFESSLFLENNFIFAISILGAERTRGGKRKPGALSTKITENGKYVLCSS